MPSAAKTINLPEDLQAFAEERVRAGEYSSVDAVTGEAFRLLRIRDERRRQARGELNEIFQEMDAGTYLEPTDEEFALVVRERTLKNTAK